MKLSKQILAPWGLGTSHRFLTYWCYSCTGIISPKEKQPRLNIYQYSHVQCANSSGRKTVIQSLCDDFDPLELSELHDWPRQTRIHVSSYSHNPLKTQRRMSTQVRQLPTINTPATPSNTAATSNRNNSYMMAGAVDGMFTGVTFNNSPVNMSISFQSNVTPTSNSQQWKKNS